MISVFRRIQPLIRPSLQTCALMTAGDVLAQTCVEKKGLKEFNLVRTAQFAGLGMFMVGPILAAWYALLAKHLGSSGGKPKTTFKKVALDQCVFAPSFILIFLTALGTLQGDQPTRILSNIKKHYPDIIAVNYKMWPAVQVVNFYFVPLKHQVLLVQTVALIFNTYISWKTQSGRTREV